MYRIRDCVNKFHPYKNLNTDDPCPCGGTGIMLTGRSSVPKNDRRIKMPARWAQSGSKRESS